MKKNYVLTLFMVVLFSFKFLGQTTETFETEINNSTSFTDNAQVFNITSTAPANFIIQGGFAGTGWNGSAADNKYIDNSGTAFTNTLVSFSIASAGSVPFKLNSMYLYLANASANVNVTGSLTLVGKLGGVTKFTANSTSGFNNTSIGVANGFTAINMSTFGGANNSNILIDQIVISTGGSFFYVALDAFNWTKIIAISASQSQTNLACNGVCNGTASVTVSGGISPYTYAWSPSGGTAAGATSLCAGNYSCTITDAALTSITKTFTITQPSAIVVASAGQTSVSCNGGSNGAASVSVSGGTTSYSYNWTPGNPSGDGTASVTGLSAGAWTCTVTDANTCVASRTFAILQPTALSATTSSTNISCNGGSNGTASVNASGGITPYNYVWSPSGGTGATASGLGAGSYTCNITDNNTCSLTKVISITQPSVLSATTSSTNISCNGGSNGTASVNASGGTTPYSYVWSPSGGTGATASGLAAGSYTCNITDNNTCSLTKVISITQPSVLSATTSSTNISCNGGSNGTASVNASGGTTPYSYVWSPSGGTGATASGLAAGSYTCNITDNNTCSLTKVISVTQPAAIVVSAAGQTSVSCNGGSNGAASVSVSGGITPYSYNWTPGNPTGDGTASVTGLSAGTWTCTVTDANTCVASRTFAILQPTVLSATTSSTNISCNGGSNGTASVNASGGTTPYSYVWSPSGGTGATASGLATGSYTCNITDNNTCSLVKVISITQPSVLSATTSSTNISCNGGSNGTASVNASGGTTPYSYVWSPSGGTGATASGLAAGSYTCNITDNNTCSLTKVISITQPAAIVVSAAGQTSVSCNGGSNGTASVSISGGTTPYSYNWTPGNPSGDGTASVTGLSAGAWTCTVTDANTCVASRTFAILQPTVLSATTSSTNISCNGGSNGTASVNASGGTTPYSYVWSPSGGTGATASGLAAGNYTCNITDNNSCTLVKVISITQPSVLSATTSSTNISCNGGSNGTASVNASGGTAPYSYVWSPSGGTGATASGLAAGSYTCNITDNNTCSLTKVISITQPSALTATTGSTNISCNGGSNGTASVNASGGTTPYSYVWSPSGGTGATASGLAAGSYTCNITDNNTCSLTKVISITQPSVLSATTGSTNISCNGGSNGTASVNVSGGTTPYSYVWSPSGGTGATASGLAAGSYTCNITDNNTCTLTKVISITQPSALSATTSSTNISCNGGSNGTASVNASGGTTPYSYVWSPSGGTGATASGLAAGSYTCNITDNNTCTLTKVISITQPSVLSATTGSTNISCNGGSNGTASVNASGGTTPYSYVWSPSGGTGATASGLAAGSYTCDIMDANGCSFSQPIALTQPAALTAIGTQTNVTCIGGGVDGALSISVSGGTAPYLYNWTPGSASTPSITGLTPGSYTCTVMDNNTCSTTHTFTLNTPLSIAYTQSVSICQGQSLTVGTSTYSAAGTYTNNLTAANACDSTVTTILTVHALPVLNANTTQTLVCFGNSVTLSATGATTYTWTSNVTDGVAFTPTATATYTVDGTDNNGCVGQATLHVIVDPLPAVVANATSTLICVGQQVTLSGSGATTYSWTGGVSNGVAFSPTISSTYTVTGQNTQGCENTASVSIVVNICTSVPEKQAEFSVVIYPNPFGYSTVIQLNHASFTTSVFYLDLYDSRGKLVKQMLLENSQTELKRETLPNGLYFYSIRNAYHTVTNGKIVIKD